MTGGGAAEATAAYEGLETGVDCDDILAEESDGGAGGAALAALLLFRDNIFPANGSFTSDETAEKVAVAVPTDAVNEAAEAFSLAW